MSGAIARIAGIASLAEQLAGDGGVTLGSVPFSTFEIPEVISWGGDQKTAVHELPGGARVVDAMGAFEAPYSWAGVFSGPNAIARAQQLDALRQAGEPIALTWGGGFYRQVVIQSFVCDYAKGGYWCPYRLTCIAVPSTPPAGQPSLLQQLGNDLGAAIGVPNLVQDATGALAAVGSAVSAAQSVLPLAGALTGGSAAFQAVSSAVTAASTSLSGAVATVNATLAPINAAGGSAGTLLGAVGAVGAATALASATSAAGIAAGLAQMGGYVSRSVANLAAAL